jgi:hypothetical protein
MWSEQTWAAKARSAPRESSSEDDAPHVPDDVSETTDAAAKQVQSPAIPVELQEFVDARGRPAVFLFATESLSLNHVIRLRDALPSKQFDEIDLVINSGGGSIHAAYQIVEILRLRASKISACVPYFAKSAATLLCVGADEILLDELAQLGPLDTQIYVEKRGGRGEFVSALNPFKTLEQLQTFSVETLDLAMKVILLRSGMDMDDSLPHAISFVKATAGPLIDRLDPEKLGEYSRALSVGEEYGKRLLRRFTDWDEDKRNTVIERLVHGYPSHDYIIDYLELQEMGFESRLFNEDEEPVVHGLRKHLFQADMLLVVEPSPRNSAQQADPSAEDSELVNNREPIEFPNPEVTP